MASDAIVDSAPMSQELPGATSIVEVAHIGESWEARTMRLAAKVRRLPFWLWQTTFVAGQNHRFLGLFVMKSKNSAKDCNYGKIPTCVRLTNRVQKM